MFIALQLDETQAFFVMDLSPTALFDSYEQDFIQIIETIKERLETTSPEDGKNGKSRLKVVSILDTPTPVEPRKSTLTRVERELDEADEMVSIPNFCLLPKCSLFFLVRFLKWK